MASHFTLLVDSMLLHFIEFSLISGRLLALKLTTWFCYVEMEIYVKLDFRGIRCELFSCEGKKQNKSNGTTHPATTLLLALKRRSNACNYICVIPMLAIFCRCCYGFVTRSDRMSGIYKILLLCDIVCPILCLF